MSWRSTAVAVSAAALAAAAALASTTAAAQSAPSGKMGFVNTERVMRQTRAAVELQKSLDTEFERRRKEIAAGPPADAERRQRALAEDMNQKREDGLKQLIEKANIAIRRIAEQENLDVVLYEAAFTSPRVDLTDRVIKALDAQK